MMTAPTTTAEKIARRVTTTLTPVTAATKRLAEDAPLHRDVAGNAENARRFSIYYQR
jgi:hypothetical protein